MSQKIARDFFFTPRIIALNFYSDYVYKILGTKKKYKLKYLNWYDCGCQD